MIRNSRIGILALAALIAAIVTVRAEVDLASILSYAPKPAELRFKTATDKNPGVVAEDLVLTQKELIQDLRKKLTVKYRLDGRIEIVPLQVWKDYSLPSSRWETEIYQYPMAGLEAKFVIGFKLFSGGVHVGSWRLPVIARHWQKTYISRKRVYAGTRLSLSDFKIQELDSLRLRDGLVPSKTVLENYEARSTIAMSQPLFWHDISGRKLVIAGENVQAFAKRGALVVSIRAKSLEDGILGDIIELRNLESNQRIEGEVVDEGKVQVYF